MKRKVCARRQMVREAWSGFVGGLPCLFFMLGASAVFNTIALLVVQYPILGDILKCSCVGGALVWWLIGVMNLRGLYSEAKEACDD